MHTFRYNGWVIHYNPDMSGDAEILHPTDFKDRAGRCGVTLPADLLLAFTADVIRERRIAALEQLTVTELILGLEKK
jgi:hypothetical protein